MNTILMTEECWMKNQLSLARQTGIIAFNNAIYILVNKEGKDLVQCTNEAIKKGREYAIEPGEPADLVRRDFQRLYRKLGRDLFIKILEQHKEEVPDTIKKIMRQKIKEGSN